MYMCIYTCIHCRLVRALLYTLTAKEPLIIGLFCRKRHIKKCHPMPLHHTHSLTHTYPLTVQVVGQGTADEFARLRDEFRSLQVCVCWCVCAYVCVCAFRSALPSLDGYCSTVQGLLDWFEVDLEFTELLFIQIDLCALYVFVS